MASAAKQSVPRFRTEDEERAFWSTHDSADYVDWSKTERGAFGGLRPSVRSISLRLPEALLERIKTIANKRDVPYQSLMKIFLAERVREEFRVAAPGRQGAVR
jgi:predicted DNA binding CopG/RHH family protein